MITHRNTLLAAAMALASCASVTPLSTPSGRPEVIVTAKTAQEAIEQVAANCAAKGLTVENQTNTMVTCGHESNILMQAMVSNAYGHTQQKYQFAAIKQGSAIKVMLSSAWTESHNITGISRYPQDLNNPRIGRQLQDSLLRLTGGTSTEIPQPSKQ